MHPAIAALRSPRASQRRARADYVAKSAANSNTPPPDAAQNAASMQVVREQWLARPEIERAAAELAHYASGADLEQCPALGALICDHSTARGFADTLFAQVLPALVSVSLGEAPFRFRNSRGLSTIQLLEAGGAKLCLTAYEPLEPEAAPRSALFADREAHEIVVSGAAEGLVHQLDAKGAPRSEACAWQAGDTIRVRAETEARQVLRVTRSLTLLQLTREPQHPAPTREVSLDTGETVRSASGDKSASQAVMALGVLGALREYEALSVMEQTARNPKEDAEVRWEAVRQTLGLGPVRGLDLLADLASAPGDPLAPPASVLREQLLSAQPELRLLVKEKA